MTQTDPSSQVDLQGVQVGIVYFKPRDPTLKQLGQAVERLGCRAVPFQHIGPLPAGLDVVIAIGPFGSLVPVARQIMALPEENRPAFVLNMTEQFPNPKIPDWALYPSGVLRSLVDRVVYRQQASGNWEPLPGLSSLLKFAHRYRYFGDLLWLRRQGILTVLTLSSYWTGDFLRARGFDPLVLPISTVPDPQSGPEVERDVPVLWLGKIGSSRRGRLLTQLRAQLRERGVEMMVIDGVEHPYVFGEERNLLLSRTKIVLNLLRAWWDDNSLRYILAAQKRALIITEPTLPHTAFKPGEHLVVASLDKLADTILYYLDHEEERREIAERAYALITSHSPLERLRTVLEQAVIRRGSRQPQHSPLTMEFN